MVRATDNQGMPAWSKAIISAAVAVAILVPSSAAAAVTPADCNVVASPSGSDSAAGTVDQPVKSAKALVDALSDGETGCFRTGSYNFEELQVDPAHAVITSFPGEQATLVGQLRIERGATGTAVEGLSLDGVNPNDGFSPLIYADDAVIRDNDITNDQTTNCLHVARYYDAPAPDNVLIEDNRIHDCGGHDPNHDHGIYIASSTNLTIRDNYIYDNADRGIQLWPDAQHTTITGNVIDNNGQGIAFGGYQGKASSHTLVENNIITNSTVRWNVESYWDSDDNQGVDNVVRNNCIYGAAGWYGDGDHSGIGDEVGFTASNNVIAAPKYADAARGDFALASDSPCAGVLDGAPRAAPLPISLDATRTQVPEGGVTTLTGVVPAGVRGQVSILLKRHGKWHTARAGRITGSKFTARLVISKTTRFKARAQGALDSNRVKVASVSSKDKD